MSFLLDLLVSTVTQGLIYGLLACGVYITYRILDFPDLTVDGSFPLGGAVSTTLLLRGAHPLVALCGALAAGAAAGLCTGLIHVKLKVRDLFSGIIMMTGLYSINLHIAGGSALMSIGKKQTTLFRNNPLADGLGDAATLVIVLLVVAVCKVLLDLFLKTRAGYLLRAAGDNETVVTALAKDRGAVKIGGLMLANALAALSGGILCQQQRLFEISMGTGAMVLGLASVIIGLNLFRKVSFIRSTTAVVVGAIVYKLCVSLAISCGLGASDLKLITALLFLLILASGALRQGRRNRKTGKGAANHA